MIILLLSIRLTLFAVLLVETSMRKYHHLISKAKINRIRSLFLKGNVNKRAAGRLLNVSASTVANYIKQFELMATEYPLQLSNPKFFLPIKMKPHVTTAKKAFALNIIPSLVASDPHKRLLAANLWRQYRKLQPNGYSAGGFNCLFCIWKRENNVNEFSTSKIHQLTGEELQTLAVWRHSKIDRFWQKAITILGSLEGRSPFDLAKRTGLTVETIEQWIALVKKEGLNSIAPRPQSGKEARSAAIKVKVERVVAILHQQPQLFGINRTSWSLATLAMVYTKVHQEAIGISTVGMYLQQQGFSFRKTREILTSPDLKFREKLDKVIAIVEQLGPNDRFFSIDELGPFAVRTRGGRSLMQEGDIRTIPAYPKPKGYLICTAALELTTNQITHFYSPEKSTVEMIKLLDLLLDQYKNTDHIFLSWDAASWHNSKLLKAHIAEVNSEAYRNKHHTPIVALAPLPVSAQFLNVIESVFAGLAKSVLHNSDYASTDECKLAIDTYFKTRNDHFLANPKRAGNKIWGKETVKPAFYEAQHCKDPKVR